MGCFLACFGITKKRRRQKGSSKNASRDQSYGRYVPLDSDVTVKVDSDEMQMASASKIGDRPKESSTAKIKKKVSFNLNVKTYEPLPKDETCTYLSEGEEKTMWEYNQEETAGESLKYMNYGEDSTAFKYGSIPSNYRYQNCRDSYDAEDEIELEESDLDDDDDDELDFDDDDIAESYDSQKLSQVEEKSATAQLAEKTKDSLKQLQDLPNPEQNKSESNQNSRNRSQYALSVLNPVENLTQWKEVKAKARQQLKNQKENVMLEQEQHVLSHMKNSSDFLASKNSSQSNHFKGPTHELAVDASLSNWLASSGRESIAKDDIAAVGQGHQRKSRWLHQTHPVAKIEQF